MDKGIYKSIYCASLSPNNLGTSQTIAFFEIDIFWMKIVLRIKIHISENKINKWNLLTYWQNYNLQYFKLHILEGEQNNRAAKT